MRWLVVALLVFACKRAAPDARVPDPPSLEEAKAFAERFAKLPARCDSSAIAELIDLELLIDRGIAGREVDRREFTRGARTTFTDAFCKQLTAAGTHLHHLHTRVVDGAPKPILRMVNEQGLEYFELVLDKHDGLVRAADIYVYTRGELMSDSMRTLVDTLIGARDRELAVAASRGMQEVQAKVLAGEWQRALQGLERTPAAVRATKQFQQIEVRILAELGDDQRYLAKVEEYGRAHPNDPALDLIRLDAEWTRERYDEALKLVDVLDKRVGGDPYLDMMRGATHGLAGRIEEGVKHARRAADALPELPDVWQTLLMLQVSAGHHRGALKSLETLQQKFGELRDEAALRADERFAALADTQEYAAWKIKRR